MRKVPVRPTPALQWVSMHPGNHRLYLIREVDGHTRVVLDELLCLMDQIHEHPWTVELVKVVM